MNYLSDWEKFTEIYNLNWEEYNNFVHNSISFQHYPTDKLEIQNKKRIQLMYRFEEEKVIWIPITKNASTSITNSLNPSPIRSSLLQRSRVYDKKISSHKDVFNTFLNYIDIPKKYRNGYKFFVITRNPEDRWVSGINEYLNACIGTSKRPSLLHPKHRRDLGGFNGDGKEFLRKILSEILDNKFIFDCHTRPQLSSINFCFAYNLDITFLKLDENLNEKVSDILKRKVTISRDNPSNKFRYKMKNYKLCHDILTKYCMHNKNFLELFKMDYYLYNSSS